MTPVPLKIFVIVGEASGDVLAAGVLRALRGLTDRPIELRGVGGPALAEAGLTGSLFDLSDLSVMGIAEVAPKVPFFLRAIRQTVAAIENFQPELVFSVDAPDFSFRVQKNLRARGKIRARQIHMVAPSVWAWRPGRAAKIARFLDGLICLFPFEPPFFEAHGLKTVAVGHGAVSSALRWANPVPFRTLLDLHPGDQVLGVFFGSRRGEVARHADVFTDALSQLSLNFPDLVLLAPTLPHLAPEVRSILSQVPLRSHVIDDPLVKPMAFRACDAALAVSGTVGLELAIADVPHVIAYRMNPLTWAIMRRAVSVKHAHLANLILGEDLVPEYLQDRCAGGLIAERLADLLAHPAQRERQRQGFVRVRSLIGGDAPQTPPQKAAAFLLDQLKYKKESL